MSRKSWRTLRDLSTSVTLLLIPLSAFASATANGSGGLLSGLLHPVLGFDHLLAMIAVGLLSVQLGGRQWIVLPALFVIALASGGILGLQGFPFPQVEGVIALSVLALGLAIALQRSFQFVLAWVMVIVFGLFHGHAHGEEVPTLADPRTFVVGFMLASAGLHLSGVAMGTVARSAHTRALIGAGFAGIGLHMVLLSYGLV